MGVGNTEVGERLSVSTENTHIWERLIVKKFLLHGIAGAAVLAAGVASVPAQSAELKVSGCWVKTHDMIQAFLKAFVEPVNAAGTSLKFRYVGGPEVTPIQKQAPALKRGVLDIIFCPGAYYGGLLSEARMPGAHTKSLDEMRKNGAWDMMQEAWGKGLNARVLAWSFFGGQKFYVYTTEKPKLSEKTGLDFTGVKVRSTGLYNPFLKAMGATTVRMSPGDVYAGLERGVVKGLAWPWGSVTAYGWEKFLKYRIKPDFYGASVLTLINRDKYNALSQAEKDFLHKSAAEFEKNGTAILEAKGKIDDEKLKKAGVQDVELTGKVRDAYIKTIYGAKWAENDKQKYSIDYQKLKSLMYSPN
jgi:TRAP-type C4-dicarboxylate transport system substrate-binding protein